MRDLMQDIDDIGNMEPVKEAHYFGKPKEFLEAEKLLDIMIKKLKVDNEEGVAARAADWTISNWPENKRIEEIIRKQFGFKEMYLHWVGYYETNAFSAARGIITMTVGNGSGMPSIPIGLTNKTYYDSEHKYLCCVNVLSGLVDMGVNGEEMMAIILHEIGHNFDVSLMSLAGTALETYSCISDIITLKKGRMNNEAYINATMNKIITFIVRQFGSGFFKIASQMYDELLISLHIPVKTFTKIRLLWRNNNIALTLRRISSLVNIIRTNIVLFHNLKYNVDVLLKNNIFGYSAEVFSDSFATAFGYGPATVSAQSKFSDARQNSDLGKTGKALGIFGDYANMIISMTVLLMDPHPMCQTRMRNQIDILKSDLNNKDVPPNVKKAIKRDLDRAQKIYNERVVCTQDDNAKSCIIALARFNEYVFAGKLDLRQYLVSLLNLGSGNA